MQVVPIQMTLLQIKGTVIDEAASKMQQAKPLSILMEFPYNHTQSGIVFAAKAYSLELHLYVSFFGYDKDQNSFI